MQSNQHPNLPPAWIALRGLVARTGRGLNAQVLEACWQLFRAGYAAGQATPGDLTPEYAKDEFLLVVDRGGQPDGALPEILDFWRACFLSYSQFGRWFCEASLAPEDAALDLPGRPALLAARWLCHLLGLRHQTVEIFIDPPQPAGHTLVQVRGMDKVDAPGAFDIPCAGHVSEVEGVEQSLAKELGEELNLRLSDLAGLRELGQYISPARPERFLLNEEYRYVYRACLKASAVEHIRFSDGEVGALAVFNVAELRRFCQHFPERVATGLADALEYYLE